MQEEARAIGRELVASERKLDQLFATGAVTDPSGYVIEFSHGQPLSSERR